MKENTVAILMATYNGEKYIEEQITSIISQTYENWILFIRDDDSQDGTINVIKKYQELYPGKIVLVDEINEHAGGAKKNFALLHEWVSSAYKFNYFMFCDQDDYWLPGKIEQAITRMKAEEEKCARPILIHTDLIVVDDKLDEIDKSYVHYRSINAGVKQLNRLLIQNNVTGCTMFWNKELNSLIGDMNEDRIVMHDWWIALIASTLGDIIFIDTPQIMYRQHGNNVVGATKVLSFRFIKMRLKNLDHVKKTLRDPIMQAILLEEKLSNQLAPKHKKVVKEFCSLNKRNKVSRILCLIKNGFYKQGAIQIIGEIIFI